MFLPTGIGEKKRSVEVKEGGVSSQSRERQQKSRGKVLLVDIKPVHCYMTLTPHAKC